MLEHKNRPNPFSQKQRSHKTQVSVPGYKIVAGKLELQNDPNPFSQTQRNHSRQIGP